MSGSPLTVCFFNDCSNAVEPGSWKCAFHKSRNRCFVEQCQNQVYARNLCVRHGGKRQCSAPNCPRNTRSGNFCSSHGNNQSSKRLCTQPGCTSVAHKNHKCVRHGGGRKCGFDGCATHARSGGYCCRHARAIMTACGPDVQANTPPNEGKLMSILLEVMDCDPIATSFADMWSNLCSSPVEYQSTPLHFGDQDSVADNLDLMEIDQALLDELFPDSVAMF